MATIDIIKIIILIMFISGLLLIPIYIKILHKKGTEKSDMLMHIDPTITNMYMNELKTMIEYESIYEIDVQFGNQFRDNKGITTDVSNDDLYETATQIQKKIVTNMSPTMLNYLSQCYGQQWILDYIKIYTLSLVLNYTDFTIYNIIKEKK